MMNIKQREPVPGGFMVTIEVPNAYTDGTSRFDRVFVADSAVRGKTPAQVRQALADALEDDPIGGILGEAVAAPPQTKAIFEDRMAAQYERWQRWKTTRIEAQARGLAAAVITALTNVEDAAWTNYAAAIQAWRAAP